MQEATADVILVCISQASLLFFTSVCRDGGTKAGESNRLNKLVRKASSVVGLDLDYDDENYINLGVPLPPHA